MNGKHDVLIVGSGFSGSIIARELAEHNNIASLVLEQRDHIAGNMFDEFDRHGILVQKYGPHVIHTNSIWIIKYLEQFAELVPHCLRMVSHIDNQHVRLPFNFETLQQLLPLERAERLLALFRQAFAGRNRVTVFELVEHENSEIREYGELLFEKAYRPYVAKQWELSPDDIDRSVLNRVQLAMNYDERYVDMDFQRLPKYGFTNLFENMLNHPNIEVRLNTDALEQISLDESSGMVCYDGKSYELVVFTGAIDELFNMRYGTLPYRSLDIRYRYERTESAQPSEIVSYPQAVGYTRSTEYRKLCYFPLNTPYTVIATEYPCAYDKNAQKGNLPYYPIITEGNMALYRKYLSYSQKFKNLLLCGRLAEYRYYSMDDVIRSTFDKLDALREKLGLTNTSSIQSPKSARR